MVEIFSAAGLHHGSDDRQDQDSAVFMRSAGHFVMALADGISSCSRAAVGACTASKTAAEILLSRAEKLFGQDQPDLTETVQSVINGIMLRLNEAAERQGVPAGEYSCTLACALFDPERGKMLYLNIGDCLIAGVRGESVFAAALPCDSRNGCPSVTDFDAALTARTGMIDAAGLRAVILCTDGAWRLMYRRNRLYPEIREMLINNDFQGLKKALCGRERFDDCTFISANDKEFRRKMPV